MPAGSGPRWTGYSGWPNPAPEYARLVLESTGEPSLSFIIPVFNEAVGLERMWSAVRNGADALVDAGTVTSWDAVIVDDGSTDGSGAALEALAGTDHRCRPRHHVTNRGLGAALQTALRCLDADIVVYTDADLPFDLTELDRLVEPITSGRADVVCARRIGRDAEGWWRAVQSLVYNTLVRALFGVPVRDVNFAAKAFARRAAPTSLSSDTGFIDVEWLVWAQRRGLRIKQIELGFVARRWGRSTLGGPSDVLRVVGDLVRHRHLVGTGRAVRVHGAADRDPAERAGRWLRTRRRFAGQSVRVRMHVWARIVTTPLDLVIDTVDSEAPAGPLLDVGCGHGAVALTMAEATGRAVHGVDIDPVKVRSARRAARAGQPLGEVSFSCVGSGWRPPPGWAAVVFTDVLYLLDPPEQASLLTSAAASLRPRGIVVVKETDDHPAWKALWCAVQEAVAVRTITRRNSESTLPPTSRQVTTWLQSCGLTTRYRPIHAGYPCPHYFLVATRDPTSATTEIASTTSPIH